MKNGLCFILILNVIDKVFSFTFYWCGSYFLIVILNLISLFCVELLNMICIDLFDIINPFRINLLFIYICISYSISISGLIIFSNFMLMFF